MPSFFYLRAEIYSKMIINLGKETVITTILLFLFFVNSLAINDKDKLNYRKLMESARSFEEMRKPDSALILLNYAITLVTSPDSVAKIKLMNGNLYRMKNEFEMALSEVAEVERMFQNREISDSNLYVEKKFLSGKILSDKGDFNLALKYFDEGIVSWESNKIGSVVLLARIYNYKGITHYFLGDMDKALNDYRIAERVRRKIKNEDMDIADILQNIAIIHSIQGRFDSAYYFIHKSRIVRESFLKPDDQRMGSFYINYGRFLLMVGEAEQSLVFYQRAEAILRNQDQVDEVLLGMLSINIGNAFQLRGDYDKAIMYYTNASNSFSKKLDPNHPNLITVANNIAFINNQNGNYALALEISEQNMQRHLTPISQIRLYRNMARSFQGLNQHVKAEEFYRIAISFSEKSFGKSHFEHAVSLVDFGDYLISANRFKEAIGQFEATQQIYRIALGRNATELADVVRKIAFCYMMIGAFAESESMFKESESILLAAESNEHQNSEIGSLRKMRLADLYFDKGIMYKRWYNSNGSDELLAKSHAENLSAVKLYDAFSQIISDESRMTLNENVRSRYAQAIEVSYLLFHKTGDRKYAEAAFEFSGKSKASVLLSSVKKLQAFSAAGVPDNIHNEERKIRQDIMAISKITFEEKQKSFPNTDRITFLESRQFSLVRKHDSILKYIEINYPEYYSLRYNPSVIGLKEVQQKLKNDEVLLEYVLGDSLLYTFVVSNESFAFLQQSGSKQIETTVARLREKIIPDFSEHRSADFTDFVNSTGLLYKLLIENAELLIQNKRLVIIPDGILGYLPFEILIKPGISVISEDVSFDYGSLSYLFRSNPVSYAYSTTLRFSNYSLSKRKNTNLLAIVPDYPYKELSTLKRDETYLPPLPFANIESESVASIWGGKIIRGEDATKANFLKNSGNFGLLHLAMHAVIDDDNPLYSRLIFQQNSNEKVDYELDTYELYSLRLNASLVVLSACNTGSGQLRFGEGIMSLTRGFFYAGVPSIVMTSWEVNDNSGAQIMESFYEYLKLGLPKDIALQKAKTDYLDNSNRLKAHPFFWASYMVIGDVAPLKSNNKLMPSLIIISSIFLMVVILYVLWKRRKSLLD
jgi:CHAT domain-containing protein/Tfp pilus assembly protein PilF